jgi:TonB family protein
MRKNSACLLLSLIFIKSFSQAVYFEHTGSRSALVSREKILASDRASQLIPGFPVAYYASIIDFVSVEISVIGQDCFYTEVSVSDTLSQAQKQILALAQMGAEIKIKYRFCYKDSSNDIRGSGGKVKEMEFSVTPGPEVEAALPGGKDSLITYLLRNISEKLPLRVWPERNPEVTLSFSVNESGYVIDAAVVHSSSDIQADEAAIKAILAMPRWEPAKNSKIAVRQKFVVTLRPQGC